MECIVQIYLDHFSVDLSQYIQIIAPLHQTLAVQRS